MSDTLPLNKLKKVLRNKEVQFREEGHKHTTDSFFPYVFHDNGALPIWQRAKITYMPRRPSLIGEIIWIQVEGAKIKNTRSMHTGYTNEAVESYITNLNGPDETENVVSLRINQLERMSGPEDFSWEDVEHIKYVDWYTEPVLLTEKEEEEIQQHLSELDAWREESEAIHAEWFASRSRDIQLGLMDETGKILVK